MPGFYEKNRTAVLLEKILVHGGEKGTSLERLRIGQTFSSARIITNKTLHLQAFDE